MSSNSLFTTIPILFGKFICLLKQFHSLLITNLHRVHWFLSCELMVPHCRGVPFREQGVHPPLLHPCTGCLVLLIPPVCPVGHPLSRTLDTAVQIPLGCPILSPLPPTPSAALCPPTTHCQGAIATWCFIICSPQCICFYSLILCLSFFFFKIELESFCT